MKLRNKKTGEIGKLRPYGGEDGKIWVWIENISRPEYRYNSLAELIEDWEDVAEEPKNYWCVTGRGNLHYIQDITDENDKDHKEIGNYFETKEEAEKAVEKLKAWKRLKDKGFRFRGYMRRSDWAGLPKVTALEDFIDITVELPSDKINESENDLELLFGGEA